MIDTIKKFWFIILVGILFLFATVFFALEQTKDVLAGKKIDGNDIVFEINNQNITADQFYEKLMEEMGVVTAYTLIERAVVSAKGNLTNDVISEAKLNAESTIANFKEYYGANYEAVLIQAIKGVGYEKISDLQTYFQHLILLDDLTKDYLFMDTTKYVDPFIALKKPRTVSHILVTMDNPDNPTEEENNRWNTVKDALAAGMNFNEAAKQYSDDTGSAQFDGNLGYMDSTTNFVPEFLLAALELETVGELTPWVKTVYGYHIIQLDSLDVNELRNYPQFTESILNQFPEIQTQMIWNYALELGMSFTDDNLFKELQAFVGLSEDE